MNGQKHPSCMPFNLKTTYPRSTTEWAKNILKSATSSLMGLTNYVACPAIYDDQQKDAGWIKSTLHSNSNVMEIHVLFIV